MAKPGLEVKGINELIKKINKRAEELDKVTSKVADFPPIVMGARKVQRDAKMNLKRQRAVDTGALWNSVAVKHESDTSYIGSHMHYAPHIEFGTRNMSARPYLRPALKSNKKAIINAFKKYIEEFYKK
jgi:HK97 gp10 family phage protein